MDRVHGARKPQSAESVEHDDEELGNPAQNVGKAAESSSASAKPEFERSRLIDELASLGTRVQELEGCTDVELENLLRGVKWLQRTIAPQQAQRSVATFSGVDKKVLKSLITSNGRISSLALSRQLDVPLTTVQRRRKRLESEFIEMFYVLKLEKLGWRRASLLISTEEGRTRVIGKQLLTRSSVSSVSTTIGEHTIDLLAEVIFRDNAELLNIIEWVKSTEGVKQVVWTEAVERLGENSDKTLEIINGGRPTGKDEESPDN